MRYNARQLRDGRWAVFTGRTRYYSKTVTTDRAEAERRAALYTADYHLTKARELIGRVDLDGAKELGREAWNIIEDVRTRAHRFESRL